MNWLENLGVEALRSQLEQTLRDAVNEVKQHTTREIERHMATLNESIDRLTAAISTELDQVREAALANLAATEAALAAATSENADLAAAVAAKEESELLLMATIDGAQARIDGMSSDFEANDPAPEPDPEPEADPDA